MAHESPRHLRRALAAPWRSTFLAESAARIQELTGIPNDAVRVELEEILLSAVPS